MSRNYIFDKDDIRFRKRKISVWAVLRKVLVFLAASVSMAVLYYLIFSLIFSTDEEKRLKQENRMYAQEYPQLEEKERMLSDVVDGLKVRDDMIYEEIFHASAPDMDPLNSIDFLSGYDSFHDEDIVLYSASKLELAAASADRVEENFRRIAEVIGREDYVLPPMTNPLKDYSFAQTGASIGSKVNPFYKVEMQHDGLDLIAPSGKPVLAAADGVVKEVVRSRKGHGNMVVIDHENGYYTKYAHLSEIRTAKGRRVSRGTEIGHVGMSGNSFAPHLHYEVLKDTVALDPVNHMFASVTPEEYINMMILSVSTGQSMD